MTQIQRADAEALATFVRRLRPQTGDMAWGQTQTVNAIQACKSATLSEIAVSLIRLAEDLTVRTPALLSSPGPHWYRASRDERPAGENLRNRDMCPEHPDQPRAECHRHEPPATPESIRAIREAAGIPNRGARHDRRPGLDYQPADLSAARNRLDAQARGAVERGARP